MIAHLNGGEWKTWVLDVAPDSAAQRSRPHVRVVAFGDEQLAHVLAQVQLQAPAAQLLGGWCCQAGDRPRDAKDGDPQKLVYEVADLWFHSMVALAHYGLTPAQVIAELERREGLSGLTEKASRQG